jgi:2-polyprenyl-6-methoxyphenol hydroxylase-like FAD-dependent oxidoreductase
MACELRRHGADCRIVDKSAGPARESRALGVHSRTLEVLEVMSALEPALARGLRWHGLNAYANGKRIVHVSFDELDAPFPFLLSLPQSETEAILIERLAALGGKVERELTLTALEQDGERVVATLEGPAGRERVETPYLLGCDGAHSAVRKLLGLTFEGNPYEERLVLADVTLETELAHDESHAFFSHDGVFAILPLPGAKRARLIGQLGPEAPAGEPTLETFRELIRARVPGVAMKVSDPGWLAAFTIHHRMTNAYRKGRVFVSGDAAHIHSPLGGQGMNTGIQDAFNLAWKLALVLSGKGRPSLLESYEPERLPIARAVLQGTDLATKVVMVRHPIAQEIRNHLAVFLTQLEVVQRRILDQASEIALNYRKSPIVAEHRGSIFPSFGAGPAPGDRAPDAVLAGGERLFLALRGTHHTLLLFAGMTPRKDLGGLAGIAASVTARHGSLVRSLAVSPAAIPGALHDADGTLHRRYGAGPDQLFLIRPDGYVAFRATPAALDPLLDFLSRIFT